MTDVTPAVALLFDDAQLGARLRDVLQEHGAHIVHEGDVASLDQQRLHAVGADVVVVSLDEAATTALDQLYSLIDGGHPRVVFNDAQATRGLTGWDRDRWARHLAVKVLQAGDVDPPRPADARELEVPATGEDVEGTPAAAAAVAAETAASPPPMPPPLPGTAAGDAALEHVQRTHSESESLSAELEALLASAESPAVDATADASGGPAASDDADYFPTGLDAALQARIAAAEDEPAGKPYDFVLDAVPTPPDSTAATPVADPERIAPSAAPADWALLDDDAPAAAGSPPDPDAPAVFGIEKLSAADFLAPKVAKVASNFEPVMNLELVSMEEAVAPQPIHAAVEMHLDELHMALSQLVLTGAVTDGAGAAAAFFAALPATSHLTFVHVQHLQGQSAAALVGQLATVCPLPVRLATDGSFAQPGEVLVAPPAQQVRVHRDGRVELQPGSTGTPEPSIDDSFRAAAEGFGSDALAIVFSGNGTDAVAGAQAIRERGGSVWAESSSAGHADVVSAVAAGGLVDFSGTPPELAARLIEVFP